MKPLAGSCTAFLRVIKRLFKLCPNFLPSYRANKATSIGSEFGYSSMACFVVFFVILKSIPKENKEDGYQRLRSYASRDNLLRRLRFPFGENSGRKRYRYSSGELVPKNSVSSKGKACLNIASRLSRRRFLPEVFPRRTESRKTVE